jgi:type IV secretory pathway TrbF-like protein
MPGPFWKILRPDAPKPRPHPFTVSGYVVDQWRRAAYGGYVIGALGLALGGAGLWWGMAKEKAPPYAVMNTIDRTGQLVASYAVPDTGDIPEEIVKAKLCDIVWHMRTLTPDEPVQAGLLDRVNVYFGGQAAIMMRAFLKDRDFFKPMIQQGMHRLILGEPGCYRREGEANRYRAEWKEITVRGTGQVVAGPTQQFMNVTIGRPDKVSAEIKAKNPERMMITDYSTSVAD